MKAKAILRNKKFWFILTAVLMMVVIFFCMYLTRHERRINKKTDLDIDISGCKIIEEKDTHSAMSDGEYLLVLDCSGQKEKMLEQTRKWQKLPLSSELQSFARKKEGFWDRYGIPQSGGGAWYFYDRYPDAIKDRNSDEKFLSRQATNLSLLIYDSENNKLFYYEYDT